MREKAKRIPGIILFSLVMVLSLMFGMALTAGADGIDYSAYIPTKNDSDEALKNKQVYFNGYPWHIINYDSRKNTATLLAADTSFGVDSFDEEYYDYDGSITNSM